MLGILLGASAGALIGILFAPNQGLNTRRKIVKEGEDLTDALRNQLDTMLEMAGNTYENSKEAAQKIIDHRKIRHNETMDQLKFM